MNQECKLLIIGKVWPEPNSSAAGGRMMELIRIFQENGFEITFVTAASESEFAADLTQIEVETQTIQLNDSSFNRFVQDLSPDVVMFDRFMTEEQFGWRVAEECPKAVRILDTEDLHCLRSARHKAWKDGESFHPAQLYDINITKREIASILRCDLSFIISEYEMDLLINQFKVDESLLFYLPFLLSPPNPGQNPGFDGRVDFMSIGNFLHEPNWNATLWLKEQIWPLIRQNLPDANLNICGAYPTRKVYQLHNEKEGFLIHGRAESVSEVMKQSKVLLAPLRFGAGLKGKLVDAMQFGLPSVTTKIGAEGIATVDHWNGFVSDSPEEFANKAVELYMDKQTWEIAQSRGYEIIRQKFLKTDFEENLISRFDELLTHLTNHRKKNFMGSMLMHHFQQGSKYMSKWIEEKNSMKSLKK